MFTPKHPRTRPVLKYIKQAEEKADFDAMIEKALSDLKVTVIEP